MCLHVEAVTDYMPVSFPGCIGCRSAQGGELHRVIYRGGAGLLQMLFRVVSLTLVSKGYRRVT